jgi:hypothetical protein
MAIKFPRQRSKSAARISWVRALQRSVENEDSLAQQREQRILTTFWHPCISRFSSSPNEGRNANPFNFPGFEHTGSHVCARMSDLSDQVRSDRSGLWNSLRRNDQWGENVELDGCESVTSSGSHCGMAILNNPTVHECGRCVTLEKRLRAPVTSNGWWWPGLHPQDVVISIRLIPFPRVISWEPIQGYHRCSRLTPWISIGIALLDRMHSKFSIYSMFAKVIHEAPSGQVNNEVGIEYARSVKLSRGIWIKSCQVCEIIPRNWLIPVYLRCTEKSQK